MQHIPSIEGGGNFFSGGDKRMKTYNHQNYHLNNQNALNCPRCNSINTKFCYYNNYNFSQPRHFCKNCRRYWTKGGVLRNVPAGGGSRKPKRSTIPNHKKSPPSTISETIPATTQTPQPPPEHMSNSHSSSENSSRPATATATEAISLPVSNAASKLFTVRPEQLGGTGSLTSTSFGFQNNNNSNVLDASSFCYGRTHQQLQGYNQVHVALDGGSLVQSSSDHQQNCDGYATTSFPDNAMFTSYVGFGSLDWHTGVGQSFFELPNTIDQSYWTNLHCPGHHNYTLFHLP